MPKIIAPAEKISKPLGASFFLVVSYEVEETFFRVKEFAEGIFSKSMYESIPMPKWILGETEKILIYYRQFYQNTIIYTKNSP
jgi:hypothetical protein